MYSLGNCRIQILIHTYFVQVIYHFMCLFVRAPYLVFNLYLFLQNFPEKYVTSITQMNVNQMLIKKIQNLKSLLPFGCKQVRLIMKALHQLTSSFLKIYFQLRWVFIAACALSLVAASGGYSLWWLLLLWSTGSRSVGFSSCSMRAQQLWCAGSRPQAQQLWRTGSVAPWHVGSSQGLNPCPLHWQAYS